MGEFWAGLAGVAVGGALSLIGVYWTLKKQEQRDRRADLRALRDAKHERLRAAFQEIVGSAYSMPRYAAALSILQIQVRRGGQVQPFLDKLHEPTFDVGESRASLLLEDPHDRVVLDMLEDLGTHQFAYTLALTDDVQNDEDLRMPSGLRQQQLTDLQKKADELGAIARQRLRELEKPVD